jgi:D-serine deaminase-like pyridoxal phosphate-dependent protein
MPADTEILADIETPALLLDLGAVERNIGRMAAFFAGRPCRLRPHVKTHKLPLIAKMQMEAGALGVTCATLKEAEAMADAGLPSILIANQIVTSGGIARLAELARRTEVIVAVDDLGNARAISKRAREADAVVNVLVEVNVGLNRCGVPPGLPSVELAQRIGGLPHLVFRGVMGYEGGLFIADADEKIARCRQANERLTQTAELARKNGIPVEIVSAGGSNTYQITGSHPGITEVQPGSYVTMDIHNRELGVDFEQAVYVLCTVVSAPEAGRVVTDAGLKAVSLDAGMPRITDDGVELFRLNEEHGHVRLTEGKKLAIGDTLRIIPSHGCTTIPLHASYVLMRNDRIEAIAPIQGRR